MRLILFLGVFSSLALAATPLPSGNPSPILPDRVKSPGDVFPVDAATVCVPGYSKKVRAVSSTLKEAVFKLYGIQNRNPGEYELDHVISLELGGNNSVNNLFPQSYITEPLNAHVKDKLENRLHTLVCTGQLDLVVAQQAIASDWTAAYAKYYGPLPGSSGLSPDPSPLPSSASAPTRLDHKARCSDFSSWSEATAYMNAFGATWLDRDHDGIACESLK